MSHIPNSAMKHAAPTHHDSKPAPAKKKKAGGVPGALIALAGTLAVGAVAAFAIPLLRSDGAAEPKRAGKKGGGKTGSGKASGKHATAKD